MLGGTSFADAQPIEPGNFTGDIVPGETQVFALDIDCGRTPVFDVVFPRRRGALADAVGAYDVKVRTRLFTPVRGQFDYSASLGGSDPRVAMDPENAERIGAAGPEIRYLNRESPAASTASASVPGTYYLTVEASPDSEGASHCCRTRCGWTSRPGRNPASPTTRAPTPPPRSRRPRASPPNPNPTRTRPSPRPRRIPTKDSGRCAWWPVWPPPGWALVALGFAAFLLLARRRRP